MTRAELINTLHSRHKDLREQDIVALVDTVFAGITETLAGGGRAELRGFGAFGVKKRPSRTGRNPRTGEDVRVEEKATAFFKAGKELRLALTQKAA